MTRITKLQRWLDLIAYLVGRRYPVPVDELMEKLPAYAAKYATGDATAQATARRTFERDKDELRALGIPIETATYTGSGGVQEVAGYVIEKRDFYLPYLRLVQDAAEVRGDSPPPARVRTIDIPAEAGPFLLRAMQRVRDLPASPLAEEAASAQRKTAFALEELPSAPAPVHYVEPADADSLRSTLRRLSDALLARKRVRFTYHGIARGEATDRDVAPYGVMFRGGVWYLVGHDALRDAVRVFHVGRIADVQVNAASPKKQDFDVPPGFELRDLMNRNAWELRDDGDPGIAALVRFDFPASLQAERNDYGELVETLDDGAAIRRMQVHQADPFLRWVLSSAGSVRILEPPELQQALQAMVAQVTSLYGDATTPSLEKVDG